MTRAAGVRRRAGWSRKAGIDCAASCSPQVLAGKKLTLSARADVGGLGEDLGNAQGHGRPCLGVFDRWTANITGATCVAGRRWRALISLSRCLLPQSRCPARRPVVGADVVDPGTHAGLE